MSPKFLQAILVLSIVVFTTPGAHCDEGTIVFSETNFPESEWMSTAIIGSPGGQIAQRVGEGGNTGVACDAFWQVRTTTNTFVRTAHENEQNTYNPANGSIASVEFGIDFTNEVTFGEGQAFWLSIRQNGNYFLSPRTITDPAGVGNWESISLSLGVEDFDNGSGAHPDFSTMGEPIVFGLVTGNSSGNGIIANYDNWSVSVDINPECGFAPPVSYDVKSFGIGATGGVLLSAQLTTDSVNDLIVARLDSILSEFAVLRNDGTGKSFVTNIYDTSFSIRDIATGDFNGDSLNDIVVVESSFEQGRFRVFLNNGDGIFEPLSPQTFTSGALDIESGDIDDDGVTDLVVARSGISGVFVFIGNGDGAFTEPIDYATGVSIQRIVLEDFDGDQDLDVGATNLEASFILLNGGGGSLTIANTFTLGGIRIAAGDLNHDSSMDLVISKGPQGGVGEANVLLNKGNGEFLPPNSVALEGFTNLGNVALGDIDRRNGLDIVYSRNPSPATISYFPNDGSGGFGQVVDCPASSDAVSVITSDLNGDGVCDVAELVFSNPDVSVSINQNALGGGFLSSDSESDSRLYQVDASSGVTKFVGRMGETVTDLAQNVEGEVFAISLNSLFRVNPFTAATTQVGSVLPFDMVGLEFDSSGVLYSVAQDGVIFEIDSETGTAIELFGTGFTFTGDLAHLEGNCFYATAFFAEGDHLIEINTDTMMSTDLGLIAADKFFPGLDFSDSGDLYAFSDSTDGAVFSIPAFHICGEGVLQSITGIQLGGITSFTSIELEFVLGDVNLDGIVDLLDVAPFVAIIQSGEFVSQADTNLDCEVDLQDVASFVALLTGG